MKELEVAVWRNECAAVFEEKGPFLRIERFEDRQVQDRRVLFDLSEVRIHGRRQRCSRTHAEAQVHTGGCAAVLRQTRLMRRARRHVRRELEPTGRSDRLLEDEMPVERHLAALSTRLRHPRTVLAETPYLVLHVDAPHLAGFW